MVAPPISPEGERRTTMKKNIEQQAKGLMTKVDLYAENLVDVIWVFAPDDTDKIAPLGRRPDKVIKGEAKNLRAMGKQLTWLKHKLVEMEQAILAADISIAKGSAHQLADLGALTPELNSIRAMIKDVKASKNLAFGMADDLDGYTTA
jgi:hypothetical protein